MSCNHMEKPLISLIVNCYNQEAFIREALEGAFSQNYSPLEIVVSDDCSADRTFEIVCGVTAAYKGPHKVNLNRNARNLGVGGNLSRAMEFCHGELLVLAPGDDVSLPERTATIVEAWHHSERKATSVHSLFIGIDETGRPRNFYMPDRSLNESVRFLHEKNDAIGFYGSPDTLSFAGVHMQSPAGSAQFLAPCRRSSPMKMSPFRSARSWRAGSLRLSMPRLSIQKAQCQCDFCAARGAATNGRLISPSPGEASL